MFFKRHNLTRKQHLIRLFWIYGFGTTIAGYLLMLNTFLAAYSTHHKSIIIYVNAWGEAHLELVFLILGIPAVLFHFYIFYRYQIPIVKKEVPA